MIPVTKPFLPPQHEYEHYLNGIWQRNWLTNNGPLVNELELKLAQKLGLDHLLFTGNGTIAIQIAIKALDLKGEIITTPFSYVATTSSLVWEGCEPVFADIDPETFNLDPEKIEAAITPHTTAILATHVYGNPCDVEAIAAIAQKHKLKVIYDGAHAFGLNYKGKSIMAYGDITTCSFHATKLFHTIEGGAVITPHAGVFKRLGYMRNFGHNGPEVFSDLGINGKNSEFHAAMGLVNLNHVDDIIARRKKLSIHYDKCLKDFRAVKPKISTHAQYNYAYYPLVLESEELLLKVVNMLVQHWIYPRRYFYPTLEELPYVTQKNNCPVATSVAPRALCLPLYHTLTEEEIDMICMLIMRAQNS